MGTDAGISVSSENCTWEQPHEQPHEQLPFSCRGVHPSLVQLWQLSPDRAEPAVLPSHHTTDFRDISD